MKKIEWLINVFYYSIYRLDYNLHLIFNKVDPTLLLLKTPYIKKQSKRQNIKDPVAHLNKIFENPAYGISQTRTFGFVGLFLFFVLQSIFFYLIILFDIGHGIFKSEYMYIIGVLDFFILYLTTLRKNRYKQYFKEFSKCSIPKLRRI